MVGRTSQSDELVVGRYRIYDRLASGGMASVYLGRFVSEGGFARVVAVKRLHPQHAVDPETAERFLEEARLVARIRHPNVVPTLDVASDNGEVFLVMEYCDGEPLSRLLKEAPGTAAMPLPVVSTILCDLLRGLHAAHEAKDDMGNALGIVHRDVSPQNVLVGTDGVSRVIDFGVAKAQNQISTQDGALKGKLAYMAPEQIRGEEVTRQTDIFAAGLVLWEALTLRRAFTGANEADLMRRIAENDVPPPSRSVPNLPEGLDAIVLRATSRNPANRYQTAEDMADALEACIPPATRKQVRNVVVALAQEHVTRRAALIADIEATRSEPNPRGRVVTGPRLPAVRSLPASTPEESGHTSTTFADSDDRRRVRSTAIMAGLGTLGVVGVILILVVTVVGKGKGAQPDNGSIVEPTAVPIPTDPPPTTAGKVIAPPQQPDELPSAAPSASTVAAAPTTTGTHRPRPPSSAKPAASGDRRSLYRRD